MAALTDEVDIHLAKSGQEAVGVVLCEGGTVLVAGAHAIIGRGKGAVLLMRGGNHGGEDAVPFVVGRVFALLGDDGHRLRKRPEYSHGGEALVHIRVHVGSQHKVGVIEEAVADCVKYLMIDDHWFGCRHRLCMSIHKASIGKYVGQV